MTLETVFNKSFKDYRKNFKITALAALLFQLLPILIIGPLIFILVTVPYVNLTADFVETAVKFDSIFNYTEAGVSFAGLTGNAIAGSEEAIFSELAKYLGQMAVIFARAIPLTLLLWVLGLIFTIVLFYTAFNNKDGKLRFGDALRKSMHYFWKFLLFILLIYLIMFLLIIGFIAFMFLFIITVVGVFLIPFLIIGFFVLLIYLMVVWGLAAYFIFDEYCGVFESLGKSKELVKGNFWRVLGYILLMALILIGVSLIFWLIGFLFTLPFGVSMFNEASMMIDFNKAQYVEMVTQQALANTVSNYLISILSALTISPFMIFYFKNLYQELKEEKKNKVKKAQKTGRKKK